MTNKTVASALRTNGYYLDTTTNTLHMTAPFEKKSNVYGTPEYRLINEILVRFPDVQFSIQKKNRKETITYEMMEMYINIMPDGKTSHLTKTIIFNCFLSTAEKENFRA